MSVPENDENNSVDSEGNGEQPGNDKSSVDWDNSWRAYRTDANKSGKNERGGVFKLDGTEKNTNDVLERRTERLTRAWSNDAGFLVGICLCFLLGIFMMYVRNQQGG